MEIKSIIDIIRQSIVKNSFDIVLIDSDRADIIFYEIVFKYNFDIQKLYLWGNRPNSVQVEYGGNWKELLYNFIDLFSTEIFLFITDDNYHPWPLFFGNKLQMIELIEENPLFEYFIFDNEMRNILFDTHHKMLILDSQ